MAIQKPSNSFDIRELVYHSPQGIDLVARLYIPAVNREVPAVVDVHGGRWCADDRMTNEVIDIALATSGIFVMAIDFRMPPAAKFPASVADINYALRWLKYHSAEYRIRQDWIGGLGTSSGGHQILLNALCPNDPNFTNDHQNRLNAINPAISYVVACWPVTDPLMRYRYAVSKQMTLHVQSHDLYWQDETEMLLGSPQRLVTERAAEAYPHLLIVQGTNDTVLSPGMTDTFAISYRDAGGQIDLALFESQPHTFITKAPNSPPAIEAIARIANFIHAQTDAL